MERLDQKFFEIFGPLGSALYKMFGVALLIIVLLIPPSLVYFQSVKNHAVISNNQDILDKIDLKVQTVVEDLEVRKQIRIDLFAEIRHIEDNLSNKDKKLGLILQN